MDLEGRLQEIKDLGGSDVLIASLRREIENPRGHLVISGPPGELRDKILELVKYLYGQSKIYTGEDLVRPYLKR